MGRLEQGVVQANIPRGRHAHAADQAGAQVGENVAKHVLGHHHIIIPGRAHQVEGGGVDIDIVTADVAMGGQALVENLAEKSHRVQHIGLVDEGQAAGVAGGLAAAGQIDREIEQARGAGAGNFHHVAGAVGIGVALLAGREQALGLFADQDQVDGRGARVGQRAPRTRQQAQRPHPGE